jgi:two-component system LytT family response regulator
LKNILVLEDEVECNQLLCDIVTTSKESVTVYPAFDEREAMQIALECHMDLFLVDISLHDLQGNDVSGVKFAKQIRNIDYYEVTPIIFVTSIANLELHSYREVSCYSYILKPIDEKKQKQLAEEIDKLLRDRKSVSREQYLYFKVDSVFYPIKIDEIITIRCINRRLLIHTISDKFYVNKLTLKQIQKELNAMGFNPFVECRRGILVNLDHVEHIDRVNKYLKVYKEDQMIDFGRTKWFSEIQGVIEHD